MLCNPGTVSPSSHRIVPFGPPPSSLCSMARHDVTLSPNNLTSGMPRRPKCWPTIVIVSFSPIMPPDGSIDEMIGAANHPNTPQQHRPHRPIASKKHRPHRPIAPKHRPHRSIPSCHTPYATGSTQHTMVPLAQPLGMYTVVPLAFDPIDHGWFGLADLCLRCGTTQLTAMWHCTTHCHVALHNSPRCGTTQITAMWHCTTHWSADRLLVATALLM